MSDVLVLGPQFRSPSLRDALRHARLAGPIVTVTAGWQEREGELGALEEHLGQRVRDLRIYERAEAAFTQDPALHDAYRRRQNDLRRLQELYRVRLAHAKAAARELLQDEDTSDLTRRARRAAIAALRRLDAEHLRAIERVHAEFDGTWAATKRPLLASQLAELEHLLDQAQTVCIAGGHVAVLLNRLRLFGLGRLLRAKPVVAWSAGAMVISERVVLFHDHPPQGAGDAEVFEAGLGLVRGTVFLPHAATRLALQDRNRVALFARRFSPAACRTLDDGSLLHWHRGRLTECANSLRLARTGDTSAAGVAP
jgi:peptidase E